MCKGAGGKWTVYGATSWGRGCAGDYHPGIWARVHKEVDLISCPLGFPDRPGRLAGLGPAGPTAGQPSRAGPSWPAWAGPGSQRDKWADQNDTLFKE